MNIAQQDRIAQHEHTSLRCGAEIASKLPLLTELTGETHLAVGTVRRAIDVLARESLVQRVPGRGTFVISSDSTGTRRGD